MRQHAFIAELMEATKTQTNLLKGLVEALELQQKENNRRAAKNDSSKSEALKECKDPRVLDMEQLQQQILQLVTEKCDLLQSNSRERQSNLHPGFDRQQLDATSTDSE